MWRLCKDSWLNMRLETRHSNIFFIEEIFTNISTEMHSVLSNVILQLYLLISF